MHEHVPYLPAQVKVQSTGQSRGQITSQSTDGELIKEQTDRQTDTHPTLVELMIKPASFVAMAPALCVSDIEPPTNEKHLIKTVSQLAGSSAGK